MDIKQIKETFEKLKSTGSMPKELEMVKSLIGNKNPEELFRQLCNTKGINADELIKELGINK